MARDKNDRHIQCSAFLAHRLRGRGTTLGCSKVPTGDGGTKIRGLAPGVSRFDMRLRRHDAKVSVNLLERDGNAEVAVTL
jgi:hypothetical protein